MKTFYFLAAAFMFAQPQAYACQYGMDAGKQANAALFGAHPTATSIEVLDSLHDTTFSIASIFSNECPSDFRLSERVRFIEDGKDCSVKIVLKYKDHEFAKSALRSLTCTPL